MSGLSTFEIRTVRISDVDDVDCIQNAQSNLDKWFGNQMVRPLNFQTSICLEIIVLALGSPDVGSHCDFLLIIY
jgi:hypothetical protein